MSGPQKITIKKNNCKDSCCHDRASINTSLNGLKDVYRAQLEVCDLLESMADSLPTRPHEVVLKSVLHLLKENWTGTVIEEEDKVFNALENLKGVDPMMLNLLKRLRLERQTDIDQIGELAAAVELTLETQTIRDAEALGYMLRCVFENVRRHAGLKSTVLVPSAEDILFKNFKSSSH